MNTSSRFFKYFPKKRSLHKALSLIEWEELPVNIYISSFDGKTKLQAKLLRFPVQWSLRLAFPLLLSQRSGILGQLCLTACSGTSRAPVCLYPRQGHPRRGLPKAQGLQLNFPCAKGLARGSRRLPLKPFETAALRSCCVHCCWRPSLARALLPGCSSSGGLWGGVAGGQ